MYCPQIKLGASHKHKIVLEKDFFSKMHRCLRKYIWKSQQQKIEEEKNSIQSQSCIWKNRLPPLKSKIKVEKTRIESELRLRSNAQPIFSNAWSQKSVHFLFLIFLKLSYFCDKHLISLEDNTISQIFIFHTALIYMIMLVLSNILVVFFTADYLVDS